MEINLKEMTIEQIHELIIAAESELELREDSIDLEELDDCVDYDDLTEEEQKEFDREFAYRYPPLDIGIQAICEEFDTLPDAKAQWKWMTSGTRFAEKN